MEPIPAFETDVSRLVWDTRYRHREGDRVRDRTMEDTWRRIAHALADVEEVDPSGWEARFLEALRGFKFLPGGRVQAGAGTSHRVTLFNCFVMGVIEDSMDGIFEALKEGALTMQQGGGVGYDFSSLRPRGSRARSTGAVASGPVSFMEIWDTTCSTLLSTSPRRGAMMATLRCDHPDIEEFIEAKHGKSRLHNFNLSVLVTDELMDAVRRDAEWPLVFPADRLGTSVADPSGFVTRWWPGEGSAVHCRILRRVPARALWERLMRAAYDAAEPGVLFIDRINRRNPLWYRERLTCTNPCGEIPLPPYGACDLGSINLVPFVSRPFTEEAELDWGGIRETAEIATRMLDNVIDASKFPLEAQARQARATRRIGLGLTGLADALVMLGLRYDESAARALAARLMSTICHAAYRTSAALAREKGSFPFLEREHHLQGRFVRGLPADIREAIATHGLRNSHLTAIAPTGTISLLANNVSSGIEPIFAARVSRRILDARGRPHQVEVVDAAVRAWESLRKGRGLPPAFVDAYALSAESHLEMQAALQPFVDSAISKTINVAPDLAFDDFQEIYAIAYEKGLKGCTTYRPNPTLEAVLEPRETCGSPYCSLEGAPA